MDKKSVKISKLLSKVLRHDPSYIGITLDNEGWASIKKLIDGISICIGEPFDQDLFSKRKTPMSLASGM